MSNKSEIRSEVLDRLSQRLQTWDGTSENANEIIDQNKSLLAELKEIDFALNQLGKGTYSEAQQQYVATILKHQQALLTEIRQDRDDILDKMQQVNKKNKIVDNYYSAFRQSIFVDKGM